ncbi:MAG: acetyl ornithine aminotransferase family protein [Gemmatimonadetes bacterium]|nr:acetyl ornithine aminotransferase family protein [Gemmatimonadota bacterium]
MKDYPQIRTAIPGPKSRAVVARDEAWTSTSYIKEYPLVVERARGAMVEDVDGNRFLDFMAGIAVAATGHAHPEVVRAIQAAAEKFLHICGSDFYYEGMAALCERLARLAPGSTKKRVFLSNSGTEAVEGAMKLARYATRRTAFIAFKGSFHGRSYGALSLTSSKSKQHSHFGPMLPDVHHVPFGYCYRCEYGKSYPSCGLHCVEILERDLFARHLDPSDVAAIFVEPIQGEGGYVIPPAEFLPALRSLCDAHGILLVCDEVQSGIGRTGKMFASEHAGVEPDIITVAKGLGSGMPIGAFIAKESLMTWGAGAHGTTFGGNPVSCAAALATLDLVEGQYRANAETLGRYLLDGVHRLGEEFAVIGEVRGLGLMIGIEFVKDRATREPHPELVAALVQRAFQRGLLLLSAGRSALRLAPPLVIDREDADIALGLIREILRELA